jgi:uncharacterized lipoprotein (TIGR02269 family)
MRLPGRWIWPLVIGALMACATTPSSAGGGPGCEEVAEIVSFEEACADERSLLALCDGRQCGMYRCQEVMKRPVAGQIVRTRGVVEPLAEVGGTAQRNWGSAQELPWDARPVFIIPWGLRPPLLPSQKKALEDSEAERNKPHERHHIFPQAFRDWFIRKGIKIDEYVIPLELEKHRSIHRGANGGPWNAAWDNWIREHRGASKEDIYRYAGQLIYEFELFGPVMPYRFKPMQPLPPGY